MASRWPVWQVLSVLKVQLYSSTKFLLGLICWGIVTHGFIDGYSHFITGLWASNNNTGETVLSVFFQAAHAYGVPNRLRGDHSVENILVAAWIEQYCRTQRGSYIWG